jgi:pentapeptide repeat protein
MIGAAAGESDVAAFRRGLARGERGWAGLTLPWDADLRGLRMVDCDLSGAILRGARLEGVALAGARLVQADLRKADLRGASLVRADLRGADLRSADLRDADLTKADLCEADLIAADLRGAVLDGMAVSFGCRAFAGVRLSGDAVRQLYSLILMTRPDDPEVVRALAALRPVLEMPIDPALALDPAELTAAGAEVPRG